MSEKRENNVSLMGGEDRIKPVDDQPGRFFGEFFLGGVAAMGDDAQGGTGEIPGQTPAHGKLYPGILLPPDEQGGDIDGGNALVVPAQNPEIKRTNQCDLGLQAAGGLQPFIIGSILSAVARSWRKKACFTASLISQRLKIILDTSPKRQPGQAKNPGFLYRPPHRSKPTD